MRRGGLLKGASPFAHPVAAMNLDVNTLFLVTIYVEAILGLLLLFAWVQNTAITAVAWWGFAHLLRAASVVLFGLYGSVPDIVSIDIANAMLFTAFALTWNGARVFDHLKPQPLLLFAGAALWLVLCRTPLVAGSVHHRAPVTSRLHNRLYVGDRVRVLARPERGAGGALAGDLHVVRARRALPVAHAVRRHAAVVADQQRGIRKRLAHGAQLRSAAVHHLDRLHPARHGQGAHRAPAQDRGAGRSADRRRQPARVPAGRRSAAQATGCRSAADRGDAARSRQFQIDQRPLRPCRRRSGARGLC